MANYRNEFEFRSALLTALGQEHTEAEAKNEEMWRRKMLDGLGVEYNQNDVNQFDLFRAKLVEGVEAKAEGGGGGGGSSDFSTAEVTVNGVGAFIANVVSLTENGLKGTCFKSPLENSFTVVLYQGETIMEGISGQTPNFTIPEGETNIVADDENGWYAITGDCTITIS